MKEWKRYYLIRIALTTLFSLGMGCLFLACRRYAVDIFDILLIAMGLMTAVINLPRFLYSLFHVRYRGEWINLLLSVASIVFGVLLMLLRRDGLLLILGIFSVVLPALRIALVEHRAAQFKKELPPMLFGFFMIFVSLAEMEETVFTVLGFAALVFAVLYLAVGLLVMHWRFSAYKKDGREDSEEK